jgi:protein-S-isoprenylcysteine O-methyltransferase Ste14
LVGVVIAVAGIVLIGACGKAFRKAGTPVRPVAPTTAIVSTGAYGVSRNPMYVGMAAVLAGVAIFFGSYLFGAALLIFVAVVHFGVVLPEERYLEVLHGTAYLAYKERVRRWV